MIKDQMLHHWAGNMGIVKKNFFRIVADILDLPPTAHLTISLKNLPQTVPDIQTKKHVALPS